MKKKLIALVTLVTMLGLPVMASAAEYHTVHEYAVPQYLYTTQDGSYTHQYISGYIPGTTYVEYSTCTVMCETEYYTYRCNKSGCYATAGSFSNVWECHGKCGQGDVLK